MRSFTIALALGGLAATAKADDGDPPPFATLDRQDGSSRVGGELSYLKTKSTVDATALRFNIYGQYTDTATGLGGYAQLPLAYVDSNNTSATGIGGAELGGIYTARTGDDMRLVLHAGVVLPTASSDENNSAANLVSILARLNDYSLLVPDALTVRLGGALVIRSGQFFARIEAGADINVSNKESERVPTIVHLSGGVGIDTGSLALTLETSNSFVNTDGGTLAQKTIDSVAFAASFRAGQVRPYAALVVGLDDDARMFGDLIVTAGVSARLP